MKSFYFLTLYIVFCSFSLAQDLESTVAQVGEDKISANELKLRFELSPYIPTNKNIDPDSIKYDFLYSLIAEKLWANEASELGISDADNFIFNFKPLEEMFIRDALFKKEVEDKVILTSNDVNNGIIKSQAKLNVQIITSTDSASILKLYNQIQSATFVDSIILPDRNISSNVYDITLGTLKDEEIEDSLYSLPLNGFIAPIKSEIGWVVFILKNKIFTPIDLGDQQAVDNMKKIIHNRRIEKRYQEYLISLLGGITIDINPDSFEMISTNIWNLLKNKFNEKDDTHYFEITEDDFNKIKSQLGSTGKKKQLFNLGDKEISVEEFLGSLSFDGFHVTILDSTTIIQKLNARVKQFVEDQMITQEGYRLGVQLDSKVRNDLITWRQNYLAQSYFNRILDTINISDKDVYNYYLDEIVNASNINLINIRLISLKDLDEVSAIFESLKQGKDFADIVKSYGATDTLVNENGETGLRPIILLGYVGSVAKDLNLNEVYGPIKRNNAYTILQVIERQNSNDSLRLSFDLVKDQLGNDLRFKKLTEQLLKITADLAVKNNVKIFGDVINKINTTHIPFFVHRLMGFGGRIAGVPFTSPFSEWIKLDVLKQKLFP